MCLVTRSQTPNIAKEDIRVYKIMRVVKPSNGDENGVYGVPPYYPFYGYRYHEGLNKPIEENTTPKELGSSGKYLVEEGYLHAFVDWQSAYRRLEVLTEDYAAPDYYSIAMMRIPAGATYYIGNEHDIAASALYWGPEEQ
jgi:hypothetical protein